MGTTSKFTVALLFGAFLSGPAVADRAAEMIVLERCERCHGIRGQSTDPEFPKLAGQNADYLTRQLANFRTGVRTNKRMQSKIEGLTGDEMRALAVYFSSKELIPDIAFDPALAGIGRKIYFEGNGASGVTACVTCHGPEGRGAMYLPRLAGQHAQYIEKRLKEFREHSRTSDQMVMHTVVQNIEDAEIVALGQFLSGLE